jgi:hypothetical protein
MSCQDLRSSVSTAARPSGALAGVSRPAGMLTTAARMASNGLCRVFDLRPPGEAGAQIQTIAGDDIQTIAGDNLVTCG